MSFRKLILLPESRYNKLTSHTTEDSKELNSNESNHENRLDQDIILKAVPKNFRVRADALLEHLSHVNELSWDDRGTLLFKDHIVPHSNISDLIRYSMREYTLFSPIGLDEYVKGLVISNIPESLIGNRELADTIRSLKSTTHSNEEEKERQEVYPVKTPPGQSNQKQQQQWAKY